MGKIEIFFKNFWEVIKFLCNEVWKTVINDTEVQIKIIVISIIIIIFIIVAIANKIHKNKGSKDHKKLYTRNEQ